MLSQVKFLDYLARTVPGKQRCCGRFLVLLNQLLGLPLLLSAISLFLVGVLAQIVMKETYFKKKKFRVGEMIKRIKII